MIHTALIHPSPFHSLPLSISTQPHLTIDPIVATSSLVMNLQTVTSRTISPLESGVVSITQFTAGDAFNVIPASVLVRGTIRALSTEMLMSLRDRVEHIVNSTATLHGCTATIRYSPDFYPPTINHAGLFDAFSKDVGAIVSKEGYLRDIVPTMGGEDFSFIAQTVPSTFFMLGQGSGAEKNKNAADDEHHVPRTDYGLHHPSFAVSPVQLWMQFTTESIIYSYLFFFLYTLNSKLIYHYLFSLMRILCPLVWNFMSTSLSDLYVN